MPDVAHGILCPRCGDGGPRIERPEHGAGGALVLSPTSVKEKSINTLHTLYTSGRELSYSHRLVLLGLFVDVCPQTT